MHILVAEDSVPLANIVRFNLERAGFRVTVSSNGQEAWELAQANQFDVVLTDYEMPKMNGIEFCKCLRQDQRYVNTPILLMSGKMNNLDLSRQCEDLNILAYFPKPFRPQEIVDTVEACLSISFPKPFRPKRILDAVEDQT